MSNTPQNEVVFRMAEGVARMLTMYHPLGPLVLLSWREVQLAKAGIRSKEGQMAVCVELNVVLRRGYQWLSNCLCLQVHWFDGDLSPAE